MWNKVLSKPQSNEVTRLLLVESNAQYRSFCFANKPRNQISRGKYEIRCDNYIVHTILNQLKVELRLEGRTKQLSSGNFLLQMVVLHSFPTL